MLKEKDKVMTQEIIKIMDVIVEKEGLSFEEGELADRLMLSARELGKLSLRIDVPILEDMLATLAIFMLLDTELARNMCIAFNKTLNDHRSHVAKTLLKMLKEMRDFGELN